MSSNSKRVWHLCSNRWNSAITEYALSSALALRQVGWESLFSPLVGSPAADRAHRASLEGPHLAHFGLSETWTFRRELARLQPDLILLYGGPETFLSRAAPGRPRLRFRGQDADGSRPLPRLATRWSMNHCAGLITPSRHIKARFDAVMGQTPVHCVPLGQARERYQFVPEALIGLERPVLRIFGRLDPVKGHATFFQLYARLLARWPAGEPRPWLEVVGQEANLKADMLRRAAAAAGLSEAQDWALRLERVADVKAMLSATHLGVIPSLSSEIICRVAQEFLMAGCPLFVSGVGSLEECLFDADAGLSYRQLAPAEQVEGLRRWLLRSLRESPAEKAQRAARAGALFSLERMGEDLKAALSQHLKP